MKDDAIERFMAAREVWQQPDVNVPPQDAAQARLRFHCPQIRGVLTGDSCAKRHVKERARARGQGQNGHSYTGVCGECASGAARASLLQITDRDVDMRPPGPHRSHVAAPNRLARPPVVPSPAPASADSRTVPATPARDRPKPPAPPPPKPPKPPKPPPPPKPPKREADRTVVTVDAIIAGDWFSARDLAAALPANAAKPANLLLRWRKLGEVELTGENRSTRYRLTGEAARAELRHMLTSHRLTAEVLARRAGRTRVWALTFMHELVARGDAVRVNEKAMLAVVITTAAGREAYRRQIPPRQKSRSRHLERCFTPPQWMDRDRLLAEGAIARTGKPGRSKATLWWVVDGAAVDRYVDEVAKQGVAR
ncbi:MAG: hypothetical protein EKK55_22580 [Rhodocyclaceae bacterium]|nr:MAG: hypothetical protein EKK55_22580 [Rhodocyclaceae bacterium]